MISTNILKPGAKHPKPVSISIHKIRNPPKNLNRVHYRLYAVIHNYYVNNVLLDFVYWYFNEKANI